MKSFESQVKTKSSHILWSVARRLPSIWRTRREARRLAASLPSYSETLALPDSGAIYSWIENLCTTPHRRPGTPEGRRAEQWLAQTFGSLGLDRVTMDPIPVTVWSAGRWSLTINGQDLPSFYLVNSAFSGPQGVRAPLVYVGTGTPQDFAHVDVSGKIVVADVTFPRLPIGVLMRLLKVCYCLSDPDHWVTLKSAQCLNFARQNFLGGDTAETAPAHDVYWQAHRRGAKGICLILRDQPGNSNTHYGPYDGIMKPMPGLWVGKHDGVRLRELARAGVEANLLLEGNTGPGITHNVWGVLPGQSDDVILVTSHHDSPFQGAVEDGSGVAQVLAQAWTWARVPKERRPKTLVFVANAGHFFGGIGADAFASAHRDLMARTRILITLEHLAAQEVQARELDYVPTGRLAFTVMFTSPKPAVVATVIKALRARPAKAVACIPADFFGPAPTSDAKGYVVGAGVPVISWIGCPYYLLDQHDTLDKIEKNELRPICETVTELVKTYMALP